MTTEQTWQGHTPETEGVSQARTYGCRMFVEWKMEEGEVHHAKQSLGGKHALRLQVERLGEHGWDWHVWERFGRGQQRYGLADSLPNAKTKAEAALDALVQELGFAS